MTATTTLILNVDDNDGARYAKTRILQVAGFDVIEAANGADALALVKQRMPDLVLLDVKLPDINGLEVCRRIKSEPVSASVLVLQTSAALTGRADKVRGLEGGADNYLAAPIGADELVANVNALLRLRQIQDRLRESEERFRQMAENISDVFWIFSLAERDMLYVSPAYRAMWGRGSASADDPAAWLDAVHPDDRQRVQQHFELLFQHQPYDEEYRIVLADGAIRWVRDRGFPVRNALDAVYRVARITSDITAAKQAEKALQEADVHKDEFLATLAHELRSPLGPIRNAVQVMQQAAPPQSKEYAYAHDVISRQVDHMARLIDDLLDIARISRGKISLQKQMLELGELMSAAVETSSAFIAQRGHQLTVTLPPEKIRVLGDPVRLAQVISNLLNNAAKYTMRGGKIALTVTPAGQGRVQITVSDNGIGVSEERAKTIFDLFAQGDAAPDLAQDGLGVGLSLVKQLVSLHDGSVRLQSQGPGYGSSFEVTLPVASVIPDDSVAAAVGTDEEKRPDERIVLIVDDNADSADTTALLLNTYGHTAYTACDAASALECARRHAPDVILLDIGLPGIDGYEVARMLRQEAAFAATRLIAITGYGADRDRDKALAAGFDHHMVKPADIQQLLALIVAP